MRELAATLLLPFYVLAQSADVSPPMSQSDIAAGAKTFRSHCAECHGLNGEGGRGPNLADGIFYHGSSNVDLLRNISEGIPGTEMPGLFYSQDRVWQVVAYVRSLSQTSRDATGDRARGETLFVSSGCRDCHRIRGDGGRLGPDLTDIGRTRAVPHLREAILKPEADVRQRYWVVEALGTDGRNLSGFLMNEDTWSVQFIDFDGRLQSHQKSTLKSMKVEKISKMPSYKDRLNEKDLNDLVAYLSSLRPDGSNK